MLQHDPFAANTFWELVTKKATARRTEAGTWQESIDVQARKVVIGSEGVETESTVNDCVEIGFFGPNEGRKSNELLYLQMHRVRSGEQSITVTVPHKPALAGIDPNQLLFDLKPGDNISELKLEK